LAWELARGVGGRAGSSDGATWSSWFQIAQSVNAPPSAVTRTPGIEDVFWTNTNDELQHLGWNGSAWTSENLGGAVTSPVAVSGCSTCVDVYYYDINTDQVWDRFLHGGSWQTSYSGISSVFYQISALPLSSSLALSYVFASSYNLPYQLWTNAHNPSIPAWGTATHNAGAPYGTVVVPTMGTKSTGDHFLNLGYYRDATLGVIKRVAVDVGQSPHNFISAVNHADTRSFNVNPAVITINLQSVFLFATNPDTHQLMFFADTVHEN
jgi:hypothetical protein